MRWVKVERVADPWPGFRFSADAYLDRLESLRAELPEGAWAYASDPDHYAFGGARCPKDLRVKSVERVGDTVVAEFLPHWFKHETGLTVTYSGVERVEAPDDLDVLGDLQLDEVLPHPSGCSHEIRFIGGVIKVECADLTAVWA